jgi:hypothetical protein
MKSAARIALIADMNVLPAKPLILCDSKIKQTDGNNLAYLGCIPAAKLHCVHVECRRQVQANRRQSIRSGSCGAVHGKPPGPERDKADVVIPPI